MRLTKNFPLEELTMTQTGYDNSTDNKEVRGNLLLLCTYILQPIRDEWGQMNVTSGYRSPVVNQAVGGQSTSQHLLGQAADFIPADVDIDILFDWIVMASGIKYGSAILEKMGEKRWIHISLPRMGKENQKAMLFYNGKYKMYECSFKVEGME